MEHQLSKDLRRYQDSMVIIGFGVIIFGAWTVIKTFLEYTLAPEVMPEMVEQIFADDPANPSLDPFVLRLMTIIFCYGLILIGLIIDLSVRIYLGRAAMTEGRGKARRPTYLIIAGILCAGYLLSAIARIISIGSILKEETTITDFAAYLFVDVTSFLTLLDLIWAGIKVRKIRKKLQEIQE